MNLKKNLPSLILSITEKVKNKYNFFNVYFQDETRLGLFTLNGKAHTARGVKPICTFQHKFENTYLFGAYSPINEASLTLQLPNCDTESFQIFLTELSCQSPKEYKIIILDNGSFHKAKRLIVPENIYLVFLPSYSPELNPAEKIWAKIKRQLKLKHFKTLNDLIDCVCEKVKNELTMLEIISITRYEVYSNLFG